MSKKSKRQVRRTTESADPGAVSTPTAAAASPRFASFTSQRSREPEFNPDYTLVVKDLRRIFALAGSFFVVLIILSFILK